MKSPRTQQLRTPWYRWWFEIGELLMIAIVVWLIKDVLSAEEFGLATKLPAVFLLGAFALLLMRNIWRGRHRHR